MKISLFFIFLEGILRLGGVLFISMQEFYNWRNIKTNNEFRILCLGASETAVGGRNTYPSQLQEILSASFLDRKVAVINHGIPNANTSMVAGQIEELIKKYRPDVITTLLGAIDTYTPTSSTMFLPKPNNILTKHFHVAQMIADLWQQTLRARAMPQSHPQTIGLSKNQEKMGEQFERALKINPSARAYTEVGQYYRAINQSEKALGYFEKAVALDPHNYKAWYFIAKHYLQLVDYSRAIDAFAKALRFCPNSMASDKTLFYSHLGNCYHDTGQYELAIANYQEALSFYPGNYIFYNGLAGCYVRRGQYELAIANYQKSLSIKSDEAESWLQLAYCYRALGNVASAQKILSRAIQSNPHKKIFYTQLGAYFIEDKKYALAQEVFLTALKIPDEKSLEDDFYVGTDVESLSGLITVYTAQNQLEKAQKLKARLNSYENTYNQETKKYYQKILDVSSANRIPLVAVQYPNLNINQLKLMLGSSSNVIYVDTQTSFKAALKQATYYDYFRDRIFGDFGHFTPRGSRLMAQNIADAILQNVLPQHPVLKKTSATLSR